MASNPPTQQSAAPLRPATSNILGDLMDLVAPMSFKPTNSTSTTFSAMNFTPQPYHDFSEQERDLTNRKSELNNLQSQITQLGPTQSEITSKRNALDKELRQIVEQKNEATLKFTQMRAIVEAETQISLEIQSSIQKERTQFDSAKYELSQTELALENIKKETALQQSQLDRVKNESQALRTQLNQYLSTGSTIKKQLESIQSEYEIETKNTTTLQKELEASQNEYQNVRKDIQVAEHKLQHQRYKSEETSKQNAIQLALVQREKLKFKSTSESLDELTKSNVAGIQPSPSFGSPEIQRTFSNASVNSNKILGSASAMIGKGSPLKSSDVFSDSPVSQVKNDVLVFGSLKKVNELDFEAAYPSIENLSFESAPTRPVLPPRTDSTLPQTQPQQTISLQPQSTSLINSKAESGIDIDAEMKNLFTRKESTKTTEFKQGTLNAFNTTTFNEKPFQFDSSFTNPETTFNSFDSSFSQSNSKSPFEASPFMNTTLVKPVELNEKEVVLNTTFTNRDPFAISSRPSNATGNTKNNSAFDEMFGKPVSNSNNLPPPIPTNTKPTQVQPILPARQVPGEVKIKVKEDRKEVGEILRMGFERDAVIDALERLVLYMIFVYL